MKTNFIILLSVLCFSSCSFQEFKHTKTNSGIEFTINGVKKRITFYDDNIVRVSLLKEKNEIIDSSLAVILTPKQINFTVNNDAEFTLKTASLILKIDKKSGAISFLDLNNKSYVQEHKEVLPVLNDTTILNQSYYKIKQAFKLSKEEGLYGLGQFQNGYMNYRNKDLLLVQSNKISIVPMLTSTNNYGILWDNYSKSTFHDGPDATYFTSEVADQIDYYFIGGKSMDNVISGYRTLTGQAPMFSKKAFGYWQSKERYKSFEELHDVVKKYRENNIPIDNIVQDWRYWGDNDKWSSMYFEPKFFADPSKNINKLHKNNIDLMVSIWPALAPNTKIFKEMETNGFLFNKDHWCGGKIYDTYNPKARAIYWNHIKEGLAKHGVDAYWMDGTEPEFTSTDNQEITESELLKVETTAAGPIAKYLNTYALITSEGVYKNHRELTNDKRVFILTRSSWAGQQRNGTVTWSGDISANFETLKKQISAGINFCMTGVPYWTHDIGGFFPSRRGGLYKKGIDDPAYQELYTRWFQYGAFSPIFRSHGTGTPREVWQFKDRNPQYYDALLKTMHLRYQLMPYIYSTSWQVTNNDYTLMRGLVMDFPKDKKTYNIPDQYMFGASIMVKPITKNIDFETPLIAEVIPSLNLNTKEGNIGLDVTYFKDTELKQVVYNGVHKKINYNWSSGGTVPLNMPESNFSVRWEGFILPSENGAHKITFTSDDAIRVWFNNVLIINHKEKLKNSKTFEHLINVKKGDKYAIKIEYAKKGKGAISSFEMKWITPSNTANIIKKPSSENVYLPEHKGWYDFWTNDYHEGGQTISKEFPIDIFPLYIKAGSIIPFGQKQQYVDEKLNAPIEIRIYTGEDAEFVYYEDEGNNYNYETGKYNTIRFSWNDKQKKLKIGESTGSFNGYLKNKTFKITMIEPSEKVNTKRDLQYKVCNYNGSAVELELK